MKYTILQIVVPLILGINTCLALKSGSNEENSFTRNVMIAALFMIANSLECSVLILLFFSKM